MSTANTEGVSTEKERETPPHRHVLVGIPDPISRVPRHMLPSYWTNVKIPETELVGELVALNFMNSYRNACVQDVFRKRTCCMIFTHRIGCC